MDTEGDIARDATREGGDAVGAAIAASGTSSRTASGAASGAERSASSFASRCCFARLASRIQPVMGPRGQNERPELTSITPHAYRLIGDEQPKVLRHARCFGTRGASVREVLRHCGRRRTAEGAPAHEAVLRHCDRRRTAEGAPAREVLRHCDRRLTAEGAPAREVLRHKRDVGPRDDDGMGSWKAMDTQRQGHQIEVFLRQIAGFLNTTGLLKAQAARPLS